MYRVYATTGVFDDSTSNKRDFQGRELLFPTEGRKRPGVVRVPGFKGQYRTHASRTFRPEQYKDYD